MQIECNLVRVQDISKMAELTIESQTLNTISIKYFTLVEFYGTQQLCQEPETLDRCFLSTYLSAVIFFLIAMFVASKTFPKKYAV